MSEQEQYLDGVMVSQNFGARELCPRHGFIHPELKRKYHNWYTDECPYCQIDRLTAELEECKAKFDRCNEERKQAVKEVESQAALLRGAANRNELLQTELKECKEELLDYSTRECEAIKELQAQLSAAEKERDTAQETLSCIAGIATDYGWNGVDNSKILAVFIESALRQLSHYEGAVEVEGIVKSGHGAMDSIWTNRDILRRFHDQRVKAWIKEVGE